MEIVVGQIYKNTKTGNLYKVLALGKHSETLEDVVVYEAQYDNSIKVWVRPANMWFDEKTLSDGTKTTRFVLIKE